MQCVHQLTRGTRFQQVEAGFQALEQNVLPKKREVPALTEAGIAKERVFVMQGPAAQDGAGGERAAKRARVHEDDGAGAGVGVPAQSLALVARQAAEQGRARAERERDEAEQAVAAERRQRREEVQAERANARAALQVAGQESATKLAKAEATVQAGPVGNVTGLFL